MIKIDNRGKCRNCRVGLTCSNCGRNHDDVRPDYYPSNDVSVRPNMPPGVVGYANRDICQCEDSVIIQV